MTRRPAALKTAALAIALLFGFALRGRAQSTQGYVEIVYDPFYDWVTAYAVTYPDYDTLYYYDPYVTVALYKGNNFVAQQTFGAVLFDYAIAAVSTPYEPGVTYSAYSEHSMDIWYYGVDPYWYSWYDAYGYGILPTQCGQTYCYDHPTRGFVCEVQVCAPGLPRVWAPPLIAVAAYVATLYLGQSNKEDVALEGPPTLEVRSGGALVSQGQTVYISAGSASSQPQMPALTAQLVGQSLTGSTNWKIHISFNSHDRTDSDWFPSSSGTTLPAASTWNISFGSSLRGGSATIHYKYNYTEWKQFTFQIGGTNPSESDAKTKLTNDPWFLTRIVRGESGIQQFNGAAPCSGPAGEPCFGGPHGWGMMQLDPPPGPQHVWDWWANVTEGKVLLNGKNDILTPKWNNYKLAWEQYNQLHPGQEVPAPGPKDVAGCHFLWGNGQSGSEGNKTLRDAAWIKRYHVVPNDHDYVRWDSPPNAWVYYPTVDGINYVNRVCSQSQ